MQGEADGNMKYLYQAGIIFLFTFLGEVLAALVPFPVPAAIWGMLLMFLALCLGILKAEQVGDCARFLVLLLPALFVAPTVNLTEQAGALVANLPQVAAIVIVSLALTFFVSGRVTQYFAARWGKGE